MNETNIGNILNCLLSGTDLVQKNVNEEGISYFAFYKFGIKTLSPEEKDFLKRMLTGSVQDDYFYYFVADVRELPICFLKEEDAWSTVKTQMRHLEKRFLFSVYQDTGIIFEKPKVTNVTFFKKNK